MPAQSLLASSTEGASRLQVLQVGAQNQNATGRVAQNWPFPLLEYWQLTQAPDPDDYDLT